MKRGTAFLAALALAFSTWGVAQEQTEPPSPAKNLPFDIGERLVYDVSWMGIKGGEAFLYIKNQLEMADSTVFAVNLIARSTGWLRTFYKVDDHSFSYFDAVNIRSLGVDIKISEGDYRKSKVIEFDHKRNVAIYKVDNDKPEEYPAYHNSHDSFSALYAFRSMRDKIKIGESVMIPVFDDRKKYELEIKTLRKERITLDSGAMIDTVVVEPQLKSEGIFQRRGSMTVWFSDDKVFAPVQVKSKIVIGAFYARLREWRGADINVIAPAGAANAAQPGGAPSNARKEIHDTPGAGSN
ncbi:MAG: DUF3108 domain-containing protein [Nitrospinae bacterium]|nr:DUF3108 domain-containing protein [Nitrospinota bacterium]